MSFPLTKFLDGSVGIYLRTPKNYQLDFIYTVTESDYKTYGIYIFENLSLRFFATPRYAKDIFDFNDYPRPDLVFPGSKIRIPKIQLSSLSSTKNIIP
jgi:hypothetical protein